MHRSNKRSNKRIRATMKRNKPVTKPIYEENAVSDRTSFPDCLQTQSLKFI